MLFIFIYLSLKYCQNFYFTFQYNLWQILYLVMILLIVVIFINLFYVCFPFLIFSSNPPFAIIFIVSEFNTFFYIFLPPLFNFNVIFLFINFMRSHFALCLQFFVVRTLFFDYLPTVLLFLTSICQSILLQHLLLIF